MNARLDLIIDKARAVLSASDQDRLAELMRRHDEPFDPAPEAEVREFVDRHRG